MWKKPYLLNDVADAAAQRDGILSCGRNAVDEYLARGGIDQPVDHAQQRGLAGAAGADEHAQHAFGYGEADIVHGWRGRVGIYSGHMLKFNRCHDGAFHLRQRCGHLARVGL
jgi:hypothetical protein